MGGIAQKYVLQTSEILKTGDPSACDRCPARLFVRTGIVADPLRKKSDEAPRFQALPVRFESTVSHLMGLARCGMVAKDFSATMVGDGEVAGERAHRLTILPHIPDVDDRYDEVIVP